MKLHRVFALSAAAAALVGINTAALVAQQAPQPLISQIRVTGQGTVSTDPDEGVIELGVTTRATTAQEAATQNAQKVERVVSALKKLLGTKGTVRTVSYNLNPEYRQTRDNDQPVIEAYSAFNLVRVTTSDLALVGRLIDGAVEAGATNAQRLEFRVKDENRANLQALQLATANAMAKAEAIAATLKAHVVRVVLLEEGGGGSPYPMRGDAMKLSTTIEAGQVDVGSSVTLTVEIAP